MEEEKKPKTPSQWESEEGENSESSDKQCCGSNNGINVESRHQEE
jgi:hypothetical protein